VALTSSVQFNRFSYHPTGRGHFTEGQGADKQYIFPKNIISVAKISDPIGLMTITIKNLATKDFDSLKKLTNLNKYKNVIFFKANKYYNLTIMYWLARIDFDISKSSHLYVEVSEVPIDENFKLLIASLNSNNTTELLGLLL
jgi:hypothetical protein